MKGMALKFTPVVVQTSLRPSECVWAYGWHFKDSQLVQTVLIEDLTHLRLPTLPHHPSHSSPTHPLIFATHDITVVGKIVAQNPAVLASQQK